MPEASFSFYPYPSTSIEDPNVNFFNNSSAASNWEWSFGDSTYSYSEEPSHVFENVGVYDVMLIAANQIDVLIQLPIKYTSTPLTTFLFQMHSLPMEIMLTIVLKEKGKVSLNLT